MQLQSLVVHFCSVTHAINGLTFLKSENSQFYLANFVIVTSLNAFNVIISSQVFVLPAAVVIT
jgi:hypothetical protein